MFPTFEIRRTQSLLWHNGKATYRDSIGILIFNPTSRKTTLPAEAKCLSPLLSKSSYKLILSSPSYRSRYLFQWNKRASKNSSHAFFLLPEGKIKLVIQSAIEDTQTK